MKDQHLMRAKDIMSILLSLSAIGALLFGFFQSSAKVEGIDMSLKEHRGKYEAMADKHETEVALLKQTCINIEKSLDKLVRQNERR